jgi:hypothetical protein
MARNLQSIRPCRTIIVNAGRGSLIFMPDLIAGLDGAVRSIGPTVR